jgi:hypothetical protein
MNLSIISTIRCGTAALSLALCSMLGGQAHAAKAIQTGTIVADSSGSFSLPLNFAPIGSAWRGAVQFTSSTPVTSHVDLSLLQSLFVAPSHGSAFITASTITGSTDVTTGTSYSSQFKLGGWPYHLHRHLVVAYYSNGLAQLAGQTTPGASVSYRMTQAGVPEPATWALMILGLGGIGVALRRRPSLSINPTPNLAK